MTDVQTLILSLDAADGTDRRQAALALGAVRDDAVVGALLDRLRVEPDSRVREDLTWAVVQHAEPAHPRLVAMLADDDPAQRRTAAHVLSKVASADDFDAVAPLVADADPDVAIKAYRAAANTGDVAALGPLAGRLGDGDALQKDALTGAFFGFGEQAVPTLVEALSSASPAVREHAADALGHLGEDAAGAVSALAALTGDPEADVRLAAVSALGQLGESAEDALASFTGDADPRVASVAKAFAPS